MTFKPGDIITLNYPPLFPIIRYVIRVDSYGKKYILTDNMSFGFIEYGADYVDNTYTLSTSILRAEYE